MRIACFPVRSAPGTTFDTLDLTLTGVPHDRSWAVHVDGDPLRGREAAALAALTVTVTPIGVRIALPGRGLFAPEDLTDASSPLTASWGPSAVLVATTRRSDDDRAIHLVGRRGHDRANLAADLPPDFDDEPARWVGARVVVGDAELQVTGVPRHCPGVYARVLVPGRIRCGDEVSVGPAEGIADDG